MSDTRPDPSPPGPPPSPVRVLILNRTYPPARTSSARLARELARTLARDGFEVTVLATDDTRGQDTDGAVTIKRLKSTRPPRTIPTLMALLARFGRSALFGPRTDLIITMADPPMLHIVGAWVARLKRARHIHWAIEVHPDLLPTIGISLPRRIYTIFERLSRRAMNTADRVIVTGRCMARYLSQNGVDPGRMTLIPNWPERAMIPSNASNSTGFTLAPVDQNTTNALSQQISILGPVSKFRVLYIGSVGHAQPIETILDAATILDTMHPEIEFIFVGPDETHNTVTTEKARRGLSNVRILPFQPAARLREIMESGDIHIVTLKEDASGLAVPPKFYGTLAAARPVILIGPQTSEIARVIIDYGAGSVIPERAAQQLAQTIMDYRFREDLWFAAQDGAIKAAAAYTAEDMLRLWVKKIKDVMGT